MPEPTEASLPAPYQSQVKYGRRLVGGTDAVLGWTGSVFRLQLDTGELIFGVRPDQIIRVRCNQRATLSFHTATGTFQVYSAKAADNLLDVLRRFGGRYSTGLAASREAALSSPVNLWLDLLRATGVRVNDSTFVPPTVGKIVLVTLGITFGSVLLVCIIAFIVIAIQQL